MRQTIFFTRAGAHGIEGLAAGDLAEPGAKLFRVCDSREARPGGDERLLREIFATMKVATEGINHAGDHSLTAAHDLPKGVAASEVTFSHRVGGGAILD